MSISSSENLYLLRAFSTEHLKKRWDRFWYPFILIKCSFLNSTTSGLSWPSKYISFLYESHPNPSLCIHTRAVSLLTGQVIPFISCNVKRCNKSSFNHLWNSSIFKNSSSFVCFQSLKRFKNSRASSFRSVWSNNHSLSHFPVRHSENLSPFAVNCLCHFSSFVGVTKKEQRSQAICLISRM